MACGAGARMRARWLPTGSSSGTTSTVGTWGTRRGPHGGPLLGAFAAIAPRPVISFLRVHRRAQVNGFTSEMVLRWFDSWHGLVHAAVEASGGGKVGFPAWRAFESGPTSQPVRELGYGLGSAVVALQATFSELAQNRNLRPPIAPKVAGRRVDSSFGPLTESRLRRMASVFLEDGRAVRRDAREAVCRALQVLDGRLDAIVGNSAERLAFLTDLGAEPEFYVIDRYVPGLLDAEIADEQAERTTLARLVQEDRGAEALRLVRGWLTLDVSPA